MPSSSPTESEHPSSSPAEFQSPTGPCIGGLFFIKLKPNVHGNEVSWDLFDGDRSAIYISGDGYGNSEI